MCKTKTTEQFIEQAKNIHNDLYDYSLVDYRKNYQKVKIICKVHDIFEQSPDSHLQGSGCRRCAYDKKSINCRISFEQFVQNAKTIHGDKYSYHLANFIDCNTSIDIWCNSCHKSFNQKPLNHTYYKQGCRYCKYKNLLKVKTLSFEQFVEKAKLTQGDRFIYFEDSYKGVSKNLKVKCIGCEKTFNKRGTCVLKGFGCRYCKKLNKNNSFNNFRHSGWESKGLISKEFVAFQVYVIKCWNDTEEFYKIGKTFKKISYRFSGKNIPYNYEILKVYKGEAREMSKLEVNLQKINKEFIYLPKNKFDGHHECFIKLKTY